MYNSQFASIRENPCLVKVYDSDDTYVPHIVKKTAANLRAFLNQHDQLVSPFTVIQDMNGGHIATAVHGVIGDIRNADLYRQINALSESDIPANPIAMPKYAYDEEKDHIEDMRFALEYFDF